MGLLLKNVDAREKAGLWISIDPFYYLVNTGY